MTIEQKLDSILIFLETKGQEPLSSEETQSSNEAWGKLAKKVANGNNNTFGTLIEFLQKEGFVNEARIITIKGQIFIRKGGFDKELSRTKIKAFLEKLQSWLIVIGTFGLFVWELLKFLLDSHHC